MISAVVRMYVTEDGVSGSCPVSRCSQWYQEITERAFKRRMQSHMRNHKLTPKWRKA